MSIHAVEEVQPFRDLDWRRIRQYIATGEIEVFRDALLSARFDDTDRLNPVATFRYDLLNRAGDGISSSVEHQYEINDPSKLADLAIDFKRQGFELPQSLDEIPFTIDQIDFASLLVEVMVRDSSWKNQAEAHLVRRYPC